MLPAGTTVAVVSRGDDRLLAVPGRIGLHFPSGDDGRYLGYHPATGDDAVRYVDQARALGAEYLVFPATERWWLDHYGELGERLQGTHIEMLDDPDVGIVFELAERPVADVVCNLVPAGEKLAVASPLAADLAGLGSRRAVQFDIRLSDDEALAQLERLRAAGMRYLVVPHRAFAWLDSRPRLARHLSEHHRFVTRQSRACAIWELDPAMRRTRVAQAALHHGPPAAAPPPAARPPPLRNSGQGALTMPRKRVLFVVHNHPKLLAGGVEIYLGELYEELSRSDDFEPMILARAGRPFTATDAYHPDTPFTTVDGAPNQYLLYTDMEDFDYFWGRLSEQGCPGRALPRLPARHQPDVIHFQHTAYLGYDMVRVARNTLPDAPIVYSLHEYLPICHRNGQMVRTTNDELCEEESPRRCHECFPDITRRRSTCASASPSRISPSWTGSSRRAST